MLLGYIPTVNLPRKFPSAARSLTTVLGGVATQMFAPSKAIPKGFVPTLNAPSTAPSLARTLITVLLVLFATHRLAPSKAMLDARPGPAVNVPTTLPSLARNFVSVIEPKVVSVTQML